MSRSGLEARAQLERNLRKNDGSIRAILGEKGFDMSAITEYTMHHLKRET